MLHIIIAYSGRCAFLQFNGKETELKKGSGEGHWMAAAMVVSLIRIENSCSRRLCLSMEDDELEIIRIQVISIIQFHCFCQSTSASNCKRWRYNMGSLKNDILVFFSS